MRSNDSLKVIVVGVAKSVDDAGLADLFSSYGGVADAKIVRDNATNTSRGFGFVTFTAQSAMERAIREMDKKQIEGRTLNVRPLQPKDKYQAKKAPAGSSETDGKRPCWMLRKGKCTKGDACPFSHDVKSGDVGSCFEFVQNGVCKRGDKCKFYHPPTKSENDDDDDDDSAEEEAAAAPAPAKKLKDDKTQAKKKDEKAPAKAKTTSSETKSSSESKTGGEADGKKPRVCFAFQKGRCHRGKKCLYLHEKLDVPDAPERAPQTTVDKVGGFEVVKEQTESGKKRRRPSEDGAEKEEIVPKKSKSVIKDTPAAENEKKDAGNEIVEEAKTAESAEGDTVPEKKVHTGPKPVCRHFLKGRCKRGKICFFLHERPRRQEKVVEEVKAVKEEEEEENEDPAPLQALADHVAAFMASLPQSATTTPMKSEPNSVAPKSSTGSQKKRKADEIEAVSVKEEETEEQFEIVPKTADKPIRVKAEKIDMGAAFDGASDDEDDDEDDDERSATKGPGSKKRKLNKEEMRANREKLRQERRAKRSAKKAAVARLRSSGEVDLS
ncbi:hypothetical protein P43SY_007765 [Pythium insidiosum]|uniref:Uncharacterized protein n=1 Tax=Pythium insidiosum TaxID=114742 RepID=A0AAD5Q7G9_PYTIN|nr:hypothetical protein P43SY_007765 [Pythium insidiosum]